MTISYNWLCDYLPEALEPEKLSRILTSIGLEVESLTPFETIKGGLAGLVIGEVITCEKHPDADKLKVTEVNVGAEKNLQIVCGAANVAVGQKVVVATVGATLFPISGGEILIKNAKIRGVESFGMLCAEDEIGLGTSHEGILVLKPEATVGAPASTYFSPYSDFIFEIGLTPNRMDAMSHLGVARDVCAYLSHHEKKSTAVVSPFKNLLAKPDKTTGHKIAVELENTDDCQRYSGITITGITVKESPIWLQNKLKAIGLRPINNVVDITNFILHETGQPLHAFDANKIEGNLVKVKNLPQDTLFVTLDDKERKLNAGDLMICDGASNPLCIGGVYGGKTSGVTPQTTNLFLESAWFNPISIRKSLVRHDLRTDAATRFEKGVDISNTLNVLKRAAALIKELAGGEIVGPIIDTYPKPREKTQVSLKFHYLKKLSGKNYHPDTVRNILESLHFTFIKEGSNDLWFEVPFSKPDVTLPADVVEEIMRIDGLDNVEIPAVISLTPSPDLRGPEEALKEKMSQYLVGLGLHEMLTNSITNSKYYGEEVLNSSIKMMNNLSADLDLLRPSMMETGLEVLAHNLNRRNNHLHLYEFGKTYAAPEAGKYTENTHCVLFLSGNKTEENWRSKPETVDFYYLKGLVAQLLQALGLKVQGTQKFQSADLEGIELIIDKQPLVKLGKVSDAKLQRFDIKQPVFYADLYWEQLAALATKGKIEYREIPKFPAVQRDLAIVVDQVLRFEEVEKTTQKAQLARLTNMQLFDVFESEKLGAGKKSLAINYVFQDKEKTMNDKEIDQMMQTLIGLYETDLGAQVRKG